jgi:DNA-binding response OmpR family regulator
MPKIADVAMITDDIAVRYALKFVLEVEGLKVRLLDKHAALEVATDPLCRCLVLEHASPRLTGLAQVEILRARHDNLPVVLLTGRPSAELRRLARQLGRCEIVEMPFTANEFLDAVRAALR